jgi:PTS system mannose-specific IIC component
MISPATMGALLAWGTVVGVDLVSFPQAMLSRPLVAAAVAGVITGDLEAGLRVGLVLELFALDVLPVGASRYPDFGPGAVAAAAFATGRPWGEALGFAVLLGLAMALVGGRSMILLRMVNGRRVRQAEAALAGGDAGIIGRLQVAGLLSDAVRSVLLTLLGLLAAGPAAWLAAAVPHAGRSLTLVAISGALVAAFAGLLRRAGRGRPQFWIAMGLLAGGVIAWVV